MSYAVSLRHRDLRLSDDAQVLPDAYAAADKDERRRLRDLLRPQFNRALALFGPHQSFDLPDPPSS